MIVEDYADINQRLELKAPAPIWPPYSETWPPDYRNVFAWRVQTLERIRSDPRRFAACQIYYANHPTDWICHWCDTFDTRNANIGKMVYMPFILFKRQAELVQFVYECLEAQESGLVEKSRDMGLTWLCCAISVHLWLFRKGADIGWGSRHADLVDRIGVADSIFEKMRILIRRLPRDFLPVGFNESEHMLHRRILNPETGSSIAGEIGDSIGRGGRKTIYFVDEAAHLEHPEMVEAALMTNTNCQIAISSVNGIGNTFYNKRDRGVDWAP